MGIGACLNLKFHCNNLFLNIVLQVCRCISELCRHGSSYANTMLSECKARIDIPNPEVESDLMYLMSPMFFSTSYPE